MTRQFQELSWLHCKKLPNLNSTFNPLLSSSYTPTPCNSSICTTRTRDLTIPASCDPNNKLCHVIVSYADASSAEGTLAAETFSLAGAAQPGTLFGCMDSAGYTSDINEDAKTTGLMGMNRGSLSSSPKALPNPNTFFSTTHDHRWPPRATVPCRRTSTPRRIM